MKKKSNKKFWYLGTASFLSIFCAFLIYANHNTYLYCEGEYDRWIITSSSDEAFRNVQPIAFYMKIDRPSSVKIYNVSSGATFLDWHTKYDIEKITAEEIYMKNAQSYQFWPLDNKNIIISRSTLKIFHGSPVRSISCKLVKKKKRKI